MRTWLYIAVVILAAVGIMGAVVYQSAPVSHNNTQEKPKEDIMNEQTNKRYNRQPDMTIDTAKTYTAVITTSKGIMRVVLDAKSTPVTVNNFVFLAREGFYSDTTFHRIIQGFMIQGGDPIGNGTGGPGYRFDDEPVTKDYVRGTIAMANAGKNTNGSQFFIMHETYDLPKQYVIFGGIAQDDSESFKTLDAIAQSPVETSASGEQSKPTEAVTVSTVVIEES